MHESGVEGELDLDEYESDIVSMAGEGARVLEVSGLSAALLAGCVCVGSVGTGMLSIGRSFTGGRDW